MNTAILEAIEDIAWDICMNSDANDNYKRSEAICMLVLAGNMCHDEISSKNEQEKENNT